MTYSFRYYEIMTNGLEGNNYLHKKQYEYKKIDLGKHIIINKISNQRNMLNHIRNKSEYIKEGIVILDKYILRLEKLDDVSRDSLLGYEGNSAKVYFARIFDNVEWKSRKPRIKFDYVNKYI